MKTSTTLSIFRRLTLVCLLFISVSAYAQSTSAFVEVKNMTQTSFNSFEYDFFVTNTGSTTLALRGYGFGINPTNGFANGGIITHSFLSRDASLASLTAVSSVYTNSQLRATTTNAAAGLEVNLPMGVPILLAKMRVTNSVGWTNSYNPFLSPPSTNPASADPIQIIGAGGKSQCILQCIVNGSALPGFSLIGYPNTPTASQLNVISAAMTPSPISVAPFLLNAGGCTGPVIMPTQTETSCNSFTWNVNNTTYTSSGLYTHTIIAVQPSCDSVFSLNLTIGQPSFATTNIIAYGSYTWACNSVTYTTTGTYTCTYLNIAGCVHSDTLHLILYPISNCTPCPGFTLSVDEDQPISCYSNNDASLQASAFPAGNYTYTIVSPTASGFSNTTGYFDQLEPGTHTVYATDGVCTTCGTIFFLEPDSLDINFNVDSLVSCHGNDGMLTANISGGTNVLQGYLTWWTNMTGDTLNNLLSNNFAITLGDLSVGFYNVSIEDDRGCFYNETGYLPAAPPIIVTINYNPLSCLNTTTALNVTATGGVPYSPLVITENGMPLASSYTAGTYTITATDQKGCTGTNVVTIIPATVMQGNYINFTWCDVYTWPLSGITYTTSGIYTHTNMIANCIVTDTLNLTINYSTSSSSSDSACSSYTWLLNGLTYTASGVYHYLTSNAAGCTLDNILNLTITPGTTSNISMVWCDMYTWPMNGITYTTSGIYSHTSINAGCVHTTYLHLTINLTTVTNICITTCDSYTWGANGVTYTASGYFYVLSQNANGCADVQVLCLIIDSSGNTSTNATSCQPYTWALNGVTYTSSGVYTYTTTGTGVCINTHTLNLTVNSPTSSAITITTCDFYFWNGNIYTVSGFYSFTSINAGGCLNSETLTLTINQSSASTSTATACDVYFWNGSTYLVSGTYTYTSINAAGCTNTDTLFVTIHTNPTMHGTIGYDETACGESFDPANIVTIIPAGGYTGTLEYIWLVSNDAGITYNIIVGATNETYDPPVINQSTWYRRCARAAGCIAYSSETNWVMKELIPNTSNGNLIVSTCNAYNWNGVVYTNSGLYTYTSLNSQGCTNTDSLTLTISTSSSSVTTEVACSDFTWTNLVTYTASGIFTYTTINSAGCDSVLTLNLTINTGCRMSPKAFLAGAYISSLGLMKDSLRAAVTLGDPSGAMPIPYLIPPHIPSTPTAFLGIYNGETIGAGVLNVSGVNAIVDWIYIEIRDEANNNIVVASQHALLQRDGDIVQSSDGISPLYFPNVCPGNYWVSVKHRNHLGVMTPTTIALTGVTQLIDYSAGVVWNKVGISSSSRMSSAGVYLLCAGDARNDKNIRYNGTSNDKEKILNAVLGTVPFGYPYPPSNNTIFGYRNEDVNMDGMVRYNNANNDKNWLLGLILGTAPSTATPNDVLFQHTPN